MTDRLQTYFIDLIRNISQYFSLKMVEKQETALDKEEQSTEVAEPIENIDKFLRSLAASHGNTGKQEKTLEKLVSSGGYA